MCVMKRWQDELLLRSGGCMKSEQLLNCSCYSGTAPLAFSYFSHHRLGGTWVQMIQQDCCVAFKMTTFFFFFLSLPRACNTDLNTYHGSNRNYSSMQDILDNIMLFSGNSLGKTLWFSSTVVPQRTKQDPQWQKGWIMKMGIFCLFCFVGFFFANF